jgi:small subunit ribosomal protein S8
MSLSDPIADMLTRIRNAIRINKPEVNVRASKVCAGIAAVLEKEGYVQSFDRIEDGKQGMLRIFLRYDSEGRPAITTLTRTSRPGRRVYSAVAGLPHVMGGLGIAIVSTSKGVMSDRDCRKANVSGEVLCTVT